MWNYPVAIFVWCRGRPLDAVILRQPRERLSRILYTDVAWEQRVSSTWNEPNLVPGAGDAILVVKFNILHKIFEHFHFDEPGERLVDAVRLLHRRQTLPQIPMRHGAVSIRC